ncbi:MAG TPA: SAF domain-containing protein [Acidimicrobiia bacterium]|nr:SAF domain-containing protein [Acidimicrobiia bacterium]
MYWLARPPYLRRTLAVLILVTAVGWELRSTPTELRAYLARDVTAGEEVSDDALQWRRVPIGILPEHVSPSGIFLVDVNRGMPLIPSVLGEASPLPEGWWSLEVPIPEGTVAGVDVRLVVDVRSAPKIIPGIVVRLLEANSIDGARALVAIPEAEVGAAAAALADGSLRTLVGSR